MKINMKKEIIIGTKLYRQFTGRNSPTEIKEYTVSKIGNKYIRLEGADYGIDKQTLRYEDKMYSQHNFQLYKSKEEIEEMQEQRLLFAKIKKAFYDYSPPKNISLEQLRQINEILNPSL